MKFFKERRLVFWELGEWLRETFLPKPAAEGQGAGRPAEGKEKPAGAPAAAPKAEVKADAVRKSGVRLAEFKTERGLAGIERELLSDFEKVAELKKMIFEGQIGVDDVREMGNSFVLLGVEERLEEQLRENLEGHEDEIRKLEPAFARFYKFESSEFPELFVKATLVTLYGTLAVKIRDTYPHLFSFKEFTEGKHKLNYKIQVDDNGTARYELSLPSGVDELYDAHAAEKQKEKGEKEKQDKADKEKKEADMTAAERRARDIELMKKHPLGALIVNFGGKAPEGEKSLLDKLLDGECPLLAFLLGAAGVPFFKAGYDDVKGMAEKSDKLKPYVAELESRLKLFRVEISEEELKGAAESAASGGEIKYESFDAEKFGKLIDKTYTMPDAGVILAAVYTIPDGKKLKIDLKDGELIIPKESTLYLDGEDSKVAKDVEISVKGREIKVTGDIPKGTVIKGKPIFELV